MIKTKLTQSLGIEYPIIQGGMLWVSRAELVAAVSQAGGLGITTALSFETPHDLALEIRKIKDMTDKPFGVNLTFLPTFRKVPYEKIIEVIIQEGIKFVETAGRNPEPYLHLLQGVGIQVMHKCTSLKHALKAQAIGCDFVGIDGFESAGHPGEDEVTSLIILPIVAKALKIPVIAAGGFGDGKGLVAALALGAEGMIMGTRFMVTQEAPIHLNIKNALVKAKQNDTVLVERTINNSLRCLHNQQAKKVLLKEKENVKIEELFPLISGKIGKEALFRGEVDNGLIACGQVIGLIDDIPTVKALMERIVSEAVETINQRLKSLVDDEVG